MKYSIQFSDAIHILLYIEIYQDTDYLSSTQIADSIQTNPANVRRIMRQLRQSELIETKRGKATPKITRPLKQISLLDVYQSIEGNTKLIQVDSKTNVKCVVGANIQNVLEEQYQILQQKVEAEMATMTLDNLLSNLAKEQLKKNPAGSEIIKKYIK